jgi:hypothetical protein
MKQQASVLTIAAFLTFSVAVLAQEPHTQPQPNLTSAILGPPLMAWSQMSKPQPVQQAAPLPEQQPEAQTQPGQPASSQAQPQPSMQTVTGTIAKEDGKYVLKASDNVTYQLDDQDKAKRYEGKQVKVNGSLDAGSNTIHVASIEPAS